MNAIRKFKTAGLIILAVLCLADVYFWQLIFAARPISDPRDYVLETNGRKDALLVLQGGARIMVDAGTNDWTGITSATSGPLSSNAAGTYIDLAIVGAADESRFGGFEAMLDHVSFGAFVFNGREPYSGAWLALRNAIDAKHIPLITIGAGDRIRYGGNEIDFLSPNRDFAKSPDPLDAGLAFLVRTPAFRTLLMSDVGSNVERYLAASIPGLSADVTLQPAAAVHTSTLAVFEMQSGKLTTLYNEMK